MCEQQLYAYSCGGSHGFSKWTVFPFHFHLIDKNTKCPAIDQISGAFVNWLSEELDKIRPIAS
jgi:hypothetical protein